jgi:hypothetical protein
VNDLRPTISPKMGDVESEFIPLLLVIQTERDAGVVTRLIKRRSVTGEVVGTGVIVEAA